MHAIRPAGKRYIKPVVHDAGGPGPAGNYADLFSHPGKFPRRVGLVTELDRGCAPVNRPLRNNGMRESS